MNNRLRQIALLAGILLFCGALNAENRLWYRQPAENWMMQALPIGNGRIGAMFFGGVGQERIQFNEKSVWSGRVEQSESRDLMAIMPRLQELLSEGEIERMDSLYNSVQPAARLQIPRDHFGAFQPFGDLYLRFEGHDAPVEDYTRALDIARGLGRVSYRIGEVTYTRKYFCSYPDQVLVLRLEAARPGKLSVTLSGKMPAAPDGRVDCADGDLLYHGVMPESGLRYDARVRVVAEGGSRTVDGDRIIVANADALTIILAANTNYRMQWPEVISDADPAEISRRQIDRAAGKAYTTLLERHEADHSALFSAVELTLPQTIDRTGLPTDERLRQYTAANRTGEAHGNDPGLEALMFQYGRYLLIASSREHTLPANLQGVWNDSPTPAWDCDYHTDINIQMNYWPAGPANLGACFDPFARYVDFLRSPGRIAARNYFGARGFFVNIYTNPWGYAAPRWLWPGAAGWLCQNLYDHFAFSGDLAYLRERAYPILKESCTFYFDLLFPYKGGALAVAPTLSPENRFVLPSGKEYLVCAGAAIDQQIIYDLFTNTIEAAGVLGIDKPFTDTLRRYLDNLSPPIQLGSDGAIREWIEEWSTNEPTHRHISHLYALYPGSQIHPETTPAWAEGARESLRLRGDDNTCWGAAWRIACQARLGDGETAHGLFRGLIRQCFDSTVVYHGGGGCYANLLTCHSPFQIDGNFGYAAAVPEMLLQSHQGSWRDGYTLELLPALPSAWQSGSVRGLKGRGNVEVELVWEEMKLRQAVIRAHSAQTFRICYGDIVRSVALKAGDSLTLDGNLNQTL